MKSKFLITGMTCSSCSSHIDKAVRGINGVTNVSVNLLTKSMIVDYNKEVDIKIIIDTVKNLGYKASLSGDKKNLSSTKVLPNISSDPEIYEIQRRLIISIFFLIPLMYISMGSMAGLPLPEFLLGHANSISYSVTQLIFTIPIVYVNIGYYKNGFKALIHMSANMDSLITIGSLSALFYGIFAIYRIGYGLGTNNMQLVEKYHMDLYFESAAMILTLITLGKYLESHSKGKTGAAITKLLDLSPKTVAVQRGGKEIKIPADELITGDIVVVRPGGLIPVDGVIEEGQANINESTITGESIPVAKQKGDGVISATVNLDGFIKIKASRVGSETTLSQVIKLVEQASASKAPIAKLADTISGIFVPLVIIIAIVSMIIWLLLGAEFEFAMSIGISVLVISCPCALGLATPVSIMVGMGKGAGNGILIKSAEALEITQKITAVAIDKTGTITKGKPRVTDIVPMNGLTDSKILEIAASLESLSEHPLASAIVKYAQDSGVKVNNIENFNAVFGKGITATLQGKSYIAGKPSFISQNGVDISPAVKIIKKLSTEGKTPLMFASENKMLGIIAVADSIKKTSINAIDMLQKMGIHVVMITGDNKRTASAIQKQLGIKNVVSEVLPHEKEKEIKKLRNQGYKVAMVGDGINDSPALASADVGIAIGAGSDIAIESADVVLIKNNLTDVVALINLSKAVVKNIKQNLFWAFFYNAIGIPIAAGVFYTILGWTLSPMIAAGAMSISSLCVVLNALRLGSINI